MQHHNYYGTNKFEFCNVKRETQDIGQCLFLIDFLRIICIFEDFFLSLQPNKRMIYENI